MFQVGYNSKFYRHANSQNWRSFHMVILKWKERLWKIVYKAKSTNYSTKPVYHTCLQLRTKGGYKLAPVLTYSVIQINKPQKNLAHTYI